MGNEVVQLCRGIIVDETNDWEPVSFPYKKFFNHLEGHAPEIDWKTSRVYDKLDGCFLSNTPVTLWDGTTIPIGKIVRDGLDPLLLGIDEFGNLIPSKIVKRFDNGQKKQWIRLTFEHNNRKASRKSSLVLTCNHHVYVNGKYVSADSIKPSDHISYVRMRPSDSVMHMIRSSLLGDGSISKNGKKAKYSEGHKQIEYADALNEWLGTTAIKRDTQLSGYGTTIHRVASKSYDELLSMYQEIYIGQRRIPQDLSWLDDFAVAKIYMDNGSLQTNDAQQDRANFHLECFTAEELQCFADRISQMYGVTCSLQKAKNFHYVRVNAGTSYEIERFWKSIAPHVVPCMRYKLPIDYRSVEYTPYEIGTEVCTVIDGKVASVEVIEFTSKNFPYGSRGYDIETTTNNYFANGILVHNSLLTLYHYDKQWHVASSGSPDAGGAVYGHPFTFRELFWRVWNELDYQLPSDPNMCYMFELMTPYNRIVVNHKENKLELHGVRALVNDYQEVDPREIANYEEWKCVRIHNLGTLNDVLETLHNLDPMESEGYVVVDGNWNRVKIKSPAYVALHHTISNVSPKNLLEIVRNNESDEFLAYFDEWREEFNNIRAKYDALVKDLEDYWNLYGDITSQKKFALTIKDIPMNGILFALRSGKIPSVREGLRETNIKNLMAVLKLKDEAPVIDA